MEWLLLILVPAIVCYRQVFSPPVLTYSKEKWEARNTTNLGPNGECGRQYQVGPRAQFEWLLSMLFLFGPFVLIAICGILHK